MAVAAPPVNGGKELICPDPSAHEHFHHQKRLQDQSATAALYVTHPERAINVRNANSLGADGKLSSAGAAASLRYARAEDLPSFPITGIDTKNSGLLAASLAHSNPKDVRYPAVEMSQDASKAALIASGYKIEPAWKPEASIAGSRAALLAHHGQRREHWQPTASKDGLQAATLAVRNSNKSKNLQVVPQVDHRHTEDGRDRALVAATLSVKGRKRAESTPATPAHAANTQKSNSLKAATLAHADVLQSRAIEQSRLTHAKNLSRDMYTEHPNVDIEKQERAHQDALKGASLSMAKKMYAMEKVDDSGHVRLSAGQAAARSADQSSVEATKDLKQQALQYLTLQDAAQRLAAERLAKIEDHHENAAFRDYYGYPGKRRSFLSFRSRNRRRATSDGAISFKREDTPVESAPASPQLPHRRGNLDVDSDDEEQAARVRSQMNTFSAKLAEADKKRLKDRETLIAAAERKVQAQMSKMDEKVYNETGKMSAAMMEDWDSRARQKAAAASHLRMQNHGKVDLGGGKFLDQSEIDAIAFANVKPTLDEINETAEKQRARDEEIRLDKEEQRRQTLNEKQRNAESKVLAKRMKADEKAAERTKKRDEKLAAKQERQRGKGIAREEKPRETAAAIIPQGTAQETSHLRKQNDIEEPASPTQKKSTWKRMIPHRHSREPGRISKIFGTERARYEEAPVDNKAKGDGHSEVDITPTGATMAGDTPATVAAPEVLPETEAAIDRQAVTPVNEPEEPTAPVSAAIARRTATEDSWEADSTASPNRNRFSRILGKLKRNSKEKSDDGAETASFSGGAKLHKQREQESRNASNATGSEAAEPIASGALVRKDSSSSISSLSSDEEVIEHHDEGRGRSATREAKPARPVADIGDSEDTDGDWEEARDRFDGDLAPPARILSKKHGSTESPVRDSKFHEDI